MVAGILAPSLLAVLVANGTLVLDCVCRNIDGGYGSYGYGAEWINRTYCAQFSKLDVFVTCEVLDPPSIAVEALQQLSSNWASEARSPGFEECGDVLDELGGLNGTSEEHLTSELMCAIADDCLNSCSALGSTVPEWNLETLKTDDLRRPIVSQLLHTVKRITKAIKARRLCAESHQWNFLQRHLHKTDFQAEVQVYLEHLSNYTRDVTKLLSLGVTHLSQLFVPLAYELTANTLTDHEWLSDTHQVRDMLNARLMGWVMDLQSTSQQIVNYKVEEDQNTPGKYIIRLPLLNDDLLYNHEHYSTWRNAFSNRCDDLHREAPQMFGLADGLYAFYRRNWLDELHRVLPSYYNPEDGGGIQRRPHIDIVGEEWQQEDKSNTMVFVHTDCLQLLMSDVKNQTCPLEDLPVEDFKQRLQCREQLWADLVQMSRHVPVTSHLAYTQFVDLHICVLAAMALNRYSICKDVPKSITQSVHDARCLFDRPQDQSCLQSNVADAICSVSEAILTLKCPDFYSSSSDWSKVCDAFTNNSKFLLSRNVRLTEKLQIYINDLSSTTLKYKYLTIDRLKALEISFIVINIFFRILTVSIYIYLPHLHKLCGKIFFSFQITGIVQIFCSDIMYSLAGVLDVYMAVQIDNALTLLSSIWLNLYCFQIYACIRNLRHPDDPATTKTLKVFYGQVLCSLILWSLICALNIALEKTSNYYLFYSRITFLTAISLSIAFSCITLSLMAYTYFCTLTSTQRLKISRSDVFGSRKLLVFLPLATVLMTGMSTIIKIALLQLRGIAQYVYYFNMATMMQGPLMFFFIICDKTIFSLLRPRLLHGCR